MSMIDNDIDKDLLLDFLEESLEGINTVSDLFVKLEKNPDDIEIIQAIFRPVHSIKGNSAFFNLIHTKKLAHSLENVLDLLRKEAMGVNQTITNALLEGTDEVKRILERVKSGEEEILDENYFNSLVQKLENLFRTEKETESNLWHYLLGMLESSQNPEAITVSEKLAALSVGGQQALAKRNKCKNEQGEENPTVESKQGIVKDDKPETTKTADKPASDKSVQSFMRVSEESVDKFLYYVGELITIGEMYSYFQREFSSKSGSIAAGTELNRINEMFHNLSSSLQKSLLDVRLLPMSTIFQKVPRIIRDIAVSEKKQIEVKISGEDIHVDKSIIEALDSPLVHIVRNAADHGIESPEERLKNNKSSAGLIEINAAIEGENVLLTIKDNGKGFNFEALRKKAVNMGLIKENEELSKKDVMALIFQSGVSTAKEITDISGRGVGMDVVKRSVEEKKGTISVDTTEGQGSVFEIKMPMSVSTVIIQGAVTIVSGLNLIFPVEYVLTTFSLNSADLVSVMDKETSIKKDGEVFSIVSLDSCLGLEAKKEKTNSIVIVLEKGDKKIAVFADEIIGIKQCVLKSIEGIDLKNKYVKGASIMGDGTIGLVLDVEKFFEKSELEPQKISI